MVMGWMFCDIGFHATIKCAELSYKLDYLIKSAFFCPNCPVLHDIIRIIWISTFRGHYLNFIYIYVFSGYDLNIVDTVSTFLDIFLLVTLRLLSL